MRQDPKQPHKTETRVPNHRLRNRKLIRCDSMRCCLGFPGGGPLRSRASSMSGRRFSCVYRIMYTAIFGLSAPDAILTIFSHRVNTFIAAMGISYVYYIFSSNSVLYFYFNNIIQTAQNQWPHNGPLGGGVVLRSAADEAVKYVRASGHGSRRRGATQNNLGGGAGWSSSYGRA